MLFLLVLLMIMMVMLSFMKKRVLLSPLVPLALSLTPLVSAALSFVVSSSWARSGLAWCSRSLSCSRAAARARVSLEKVLIGPRRECLAVYCWVLQLVMLCATRAAQRR